MVFSKNTILRKIEDGLIKINPFSQSSLGLACYNLRLGSLFQQEGTNKWEKHLDFHIPSQGFVLAKTNEKITLSPKVGCMIFTTGSLAKKGIDVIQSSSFCEPDTNNEMTLEIVNHGKQEFILKVGIVVAKAVFMEVI